MDSGGPKRHLGLVERSPARKKLLQGEVLNFLWQKYVTERDAETRSQLLEQYLGLVHHAAREIVQQVTASLELDDLISAGTVGLVQALECFDPSRGFAFSSYALPRIRGAIIDELRSWDWVPRSVRSRNREIRKASDDLRQKLGREPAPQEVAESLGLDLEVYWRYSDRMKDPVLLPLDPTPESGEGAEFRLSETLADESVPDQSEVMERSETLGQLGEAFDSLSRRDRLILTLSFFERLTLHQIGEILHISESRVSQLRTRALKRVQERLEFKEAA